MFQSTNINIKLFNRYIKNLKQLADVGSEFYFINSNN